jgi:hypothetical protein
VESTDVPIDENLSLCLSPSDVLDYLGGKWVLVVNSNDSQPGQHSPKVAFVRFEVLLQYSCSHLEKREHQCGLLY